MVKKIIWGLVAVIILVIFTAWLTQDHWLPQWNQSIADQTTEYHEKGLSFAATHDQVACLDEALTEYNLCKGFSCTLIHGKFLRACLSEASATEGFCDDVPAFNEKATEDEKTWARHACWDKNIGGDGCRLLMRQQQFFCASR